VTAAEIEQLLRRVIREELAAWETRRAVSDTSAIERDELDDELAELVTERAARLRKRSKAVSR
jgi:hypothetical protein